jgi:hypothetical protein
MSFQDHKADSKSGDEAFVGRRDGKPQIAAQFRCERAGIS